MTDTANTLPADLSVEVLIQTLASNLRTATARREQAQHEFHEVTEPDAEHTEEFITEYRNRYLLAREAAGAIRSTILDLPRDLRTAIFERV